MADVDVHENMDEDWGSFEALTGGDAEDRHDSVIDAEAHDEISDGTNTLEHTERVSDGHGETVIDDGELESEGLDGEPLSASAPAAASKAGFLSSKAALYGLPALLVVGVAGFLFIPRLLHHPAPEMGDSLGAPQARSPMPARAPKPMPHLTAAMPQPAKPMASTAGPTKPVAPPAASAPVSSTVSGALETSVTSMPKASRPAAPKVAASGGGLDSSEAAQALAKTQSALNKLLGNQQTLLAQIGVMQSRLDGLKNTKTRVIYRTRYKIKTVYRGHTHGQVSVPAGGHSRWLSGFTLIGWGRGYAAVKSADGHVRMVRVGQRVDGVLIERIESDRVVTSAGDIRGLPG